MTNVLEPVHNTVATPLAASDLLPVVVDPAKVIVTDEPCVIVCVDDELL